MKTNRQTARITPRLEGTAKKLRHRLFPAVLGSVVLVGLTLSAGRANARPEYHEAIYEALPPADPTCNPNMCVMCHSSNLGGLTTVLATPPSFYIALVTAQGSPTVPSTLGPALERMRMNMIDTDMDGTIDVEEIQQGTNPSSADPRSYCGGPQYGCGAEARIAPGSQSSSPNLPATFFAGLTVLGLLLWRKSRRS